MTQHQHYDRQPLVEAVFELFAQPDPSSTWPPSLVANAKASFPDYQFHEERLRDLGVRLQVTDQVLKQAPLEARDRVRLWDSAHHRAIQFGPHMCAHNVLASAYTHFDDHRRAIGDVFRFYLDHVGPEGIAWIGQRYINVVRTPLNDHDVAQYFEIYPRLPQRLAGGHRPLAVQIETVKLKRGTGTAMVNLSLQSTTQHEAIYVLDIYARSSGEVPRDVDALLSWQTEAHEAVWTSFDLSVSEKCKKELFKERP